MQSCVRVLYSSVLGKVVLAVGVPCPLGVFQRPVFVWCLRSAHAQATSQLSFWAKL